MADSPDEAPPELIPKPKNYAELLALSISILSPGVDLQTGGDTPPPPPPQAQQQHAGAHRRASDQLVYYDALSPATEEEARLAGLVSSQPLPAPAPLSAHATATPAPSSPTPAALPYSAPVPDGQTTGKEAVALETHDLTTPVAVVPSPPVLPVLPVLAPAAPSPAESMTVTPSPVQEHASSSSSCSPPPGVIAVEEEKEDNTSPLSKVLSPLPAVLASSSPSLFASQRQQAATTPASPPSPARATLSTTTTLSTTSSAVWSPRVDPLPALKPTATHPLVEPSSPPSPKQASVTFAMAPSSHVPPPSNISPPPALPTTTTVATIATTTVASTSSSSSSSKKNKRKPSPLDKARWPSVLFLSWLDPLLWQGAHKPLEDEDVPAVPTVHASRVVRNRVVAFQRTHPRTSFGAVIFRTFFWRWMCGFVGQCIFVGAFIMQPFWVGALLQYIADKMNNRPVAGAYFLGLENGYYLAACLVATSFLAVLSINSTFYHQTRFGTYLRTATQVMVYEKSMRLSPAARRKYTTGAIVTMMGVDSERIYQGVLTSQWVWAAPVVILVSIFLTIGVLGKAGLVGAGLMVLCMFFQAYSAYGNGKAREILVRLTDERVKLTNEVLQGIRVIKLCAWEGPVGEMIERVRKEEIVALAALLMIKVTAVVVLFLAPVLVSVVTFTVYFYIDDEPRLDRVFTALAFMNLIRLPMSAMPNAVANLADYRIAMRRVNAFMLEKELEPAATPTPPPTDDSASTGEGDIVIRLEHADFTWADDELATASAAAAAIAVQKEKEAAAAAKKAAKAKKKGKPKAVIVAKTDADAFTAATALPATAPADEEAPARVVSSALTSPMRHLPLTLENINLKVKQGQLVAVIGAVGAGKSSLVSAVLGEIACVRGRRELLGNVAYVGQEAWIQNLTVRQCILFGKPYDRTKYRATVAAAQLKTDLENLDAGDATEIGERGINLSGGQKARVSLARAIYADADVYIMDDPLSAVDAHVSRAIFDEAICDRLAGKTRLLILSSNYHLLSAADQILILEGGRVVGSGSFQKLAPKFPQYFKKPASPVDPLPVLCTQMSQSAACFDRLPSMVMVENDELDATEGNENGTAALGALIGKEDREVGSVSFGVYIQYFAGATKTRAGGIWLAWSLLFIFGLGQAMRVMVDLWLTRAAEAISGETTNMRDLARSMDFWVSVYWTFAVLTVGLALLRSRMLLWASIRSCSRLHDRLMRGVLRAPVNMYFDVVPLGRILNRFSKDLDHVDQVLPDNLLQLLQNGIFVLSILGLCLSSSLWFILFFAPIILIFYVAYLFFRKTSREVKRLEGVSRSPIYSSFSEMLQGLVSIRAFRRNQDFVTRHYDAVDHNTSLFLLFWLTSRWLAIRLDMLSTSVMLVLAFLGVTLCNLGEKNEERIQMSPSILGLALIYTLQLTGLLQWTVRLVVETENSFTAVERLVTFLELPEEAPEVTAVRPPQDWPQHGAIEIENLSMRYRPDLDTILTNLSLSIQAGAKVGVVGRTGAGKSSLGQAIFRMVEAEPGGSIVIDGIDIAKLGLNDLRSRLTVIPQDPVVFSGTVRFNLDPLGQSDDASIWEALRRVYLHDDIKALPLQLDTLVAERGENFSIGQKQLLCIGRALLRKSKIIIMDEATACVDTTTDRKIQETIRKNFADCTILTVAHRLDTIIDYSMIVVLDKGQVVEYGTPHELLQIQGGHFVRLIEELGEEAAASMREIALQATEWGVNATESREKERRAQESQAVRMA